MYQPHDTAWCFLTFILLLALAGLLLFLRQQKRLPLPRWLPPGLAVLAGLQIACAGIIRIWDEREMRDELRNIPRGHIGRLALSRDGVRKEITDSHEVSALISLVQSLRYVGPHHSSPVDLFELTIESDRNSYRYQIGRDSERRDEY